MKFSELHNRIRLKIKVKSSKFTPPHLEVITPDVDEILEIFDLELREEPKYIRYHSLQRAKCYGHFQCEPEEIVEDHFEIIDHVQVSERKIIIDLPGKNSWNYEFPDSPDSIIEWDDPLRWVVMLNIPRPARPVRPLFIMSSQGNVEHLIPPPHLPRMQYCRWGLICHDGETEFGATCSCGIAFNINIIGGTLKSLGQTK